MVQTSHSGSPLVVHIVKRYAGSRLYDTSTLSYVTVDQLRALLRADADVTVYDATNGADVTLSVLGTHQRHRRYPHVDTTVFHRPRVGVNLRRTKA